MRKAEFVKQAGAFYAPVYWSKGENVKQFAVYHAFGHRWENTADPEIEDFRVFLTEDEAIAYVESISLSIGFEAMIEKNTFTYYHFIRSFNFGEEFELDDLTYKNINSIEGKGMNSIASNEGEDIAGAVIVEWSYEKFVGYARNLINIGFASEWPFHGLKTEQDLITGNEESTFRSNYSVLLAAEEIEGVSGAELQEMIEKALNDGRWKWNYFKNNPDSAFIKDRIEEIVN